MLAWLGYSTEPIEQFDNSINQNNFFNDLPYNCKVPSISIDECQAEYYSLVEELVETPDKEIDNQINIHLCKCNKLYENKWLTAFNSKSIILARIKYAYRERVEKEEVLSQFNKRTIDLSTIFNDDIFPISKRERQRIQDGYQGHEYYMKVLGDIPELSVKPAEILICHFSKSTFSLGYEDIIKQNIQSLMFTLNEYIDSFDYLVNKEIKDKNNLKEVYIERYINGLKREKINAINLKKELILIEIKILAFKIKFELLGQQKVKNSDYTQAKILLSETELIIRNNRPLLDDLYNKEIANNALIRNKELSSKLINMIYRYNNYITSEESS